MPAIEIRIAYNDPDENDEYVWKDAVFVDGVDSMWTHVEMLSLAYVKARNRIEEHVRATDTED